MSWATGFSAQDEDRGTDGLGTRKRVARRAAGEPSVGGVTDSEHLVSLDGESYYQDPAGAFARLRESRPVTPALVRGYGRVWVVTRYADVRAALTDPRLAKDVRRFPGGGKSRPSEAAGGVHAHVLNVDPPDHTRARRV